MKYRRLHPWNVSVARAARIQLTLRSRVRLTPLRSGSRIACVAGADVSYDRGSDLIFGAVVVLSYPDLEVIETAGHVARARFPYVPGYLSFREIPVLLGAFRKIKTRPGIVICDGQGVAHPRRFGLASHLGLLLATPSIGCAKSRLVGDHDELRRERGSSTPLLFEGREVGSVVRTRDGVAPLYVSPGHRLDVEGAARIVLSCCRRVRLPEPTRQAHMEVNVLRAGSAKAAPG